MSSWPTRQFTTKSGDPFVIRTARSDDAAAMLAYIQRIAGETEFFVLEPDEFPATEEQERKWVQDHFERPGQIVLLAEAAGTIVGSVSFENGPHRRVAHRGTLGIAVAENWRGQGVGRALLEALLEWASDSPLIDKVDLEVFATNETAIRLYRKLGFVEGSLKPREIKLGPGRYVDTLPMHRFV